MAKVRLLSGLLLSFLLSSISLANPVLDHVTSGNVSISQTPNVTTINQTSGKAILNWQSFNIGSGEATHFIQPAGGVALNRINPTQGASQIYGVLTATGQIILVNPAGIYFGPGSYVNVGGMIATTSNISDKNFLSGNYIFDQPSLYAHADIINAGTIIAAKNGMIALVGNNVTNSGMIEANLGRVVLASGDTFTVDFSGDGMINFAVKDSPSFQGGSVTNTGSVIADGGQVLVSAQQASGVLDNVINLQGVIQVRSIYKQSGELIISGDPNAGVVTIDANLDVSGAGTKGGTVNITGHDIWLQSVSLINASGDQGGGIVNVGGNEHGQGPLPNANAVVMSQGAVINANANINGNGGSVVLWSETSTQVAGNISAKGGSESGNGGLVETSSHDLLEASNAIINTSAPHGETGTWLLDPTNIYIALNQANATTAGMSGTNTSANTGTGTNPETFAGTGAIQDSLLTTGALTTGLNANNVVVTTTNASGTGLGNITVVDPITWASGNSLTLTAANNIAINNTITIGNSAAAQLILNAVSTVSQTAAIGGLGSLVAEGGATVTLSLTNTYTGTSTVTDGNLRATIAGGFGPSGGGGIFITPLASDTAILGLGGLSTNLTNISTITIDSSNTGSTAQLNGAAGTVTFSNPVILIGGTNNIAANASTTALSGTITGSGALNVTAGILQFNGTSNTYSGITTINAATLQAGAANSLSANSVINLANVASTTLNLNNFNNTIASLTVGGTTGGNVTLGTGTLTIANSTASSSGSYAGVISGTGGLTINLTGTGSPVQTLTGINTFTGATILTAGNLSISADSGLGTAPGSATAGQIAFDGGTLEASTGFTLNSNRGIALNAGGGTIQVDGSGTLTYSGIIAGANNLTKSGAGTLTLGGTDTYTGTTTVNNGNLRSIVAGGFGPSGAGGIFITPLASDNATIGLGGLSTNLTNTSTITLNSSNTGSTAEFNGAAGTVTFSNPFILIGGTNEIFATSSTTTLSGTITGSGALSVNAGVLQFNGTSNTYSGTTTIDAGTLQAGAANSLSASSAISLANVSGAILNLNNFNNTIASLTVGGTTGGNVTLGTGTLTIANSTASSSTSYAGVISGTGGLTINLTGTGSPVQTLTGINTFTGATILTAGNLSISADSGLGTAPGSATAGQIAFDGGTLEASTGFTLNSNRGIALNAGGGTIQVDAGTLAYGGIIAGLNGLTKTGAGILQFNGTSNTYSGTTTINAGTLQAGAANSLSASSAINLANVSGAILNLNNFSNSIASLAGGGGTGGNVSLGSGTLTIANSTASSSTSYAGVLSGTGGLTINLTGTGSPVQTLTGINTFSGVTTLTQGILSISADSGLGTAPGSATAGQIAFGGGILDASTGFTLNSNRGIALNAGGGTIEVDAGTLAYGGIIAGANALTKTGAGTLTLSGVNTYTGATNINAGILSIAADSGLGTAPGSTTANDLNFGGGTLDVSSGFTLNSNRGIASNAGGGTIEVDAGTLAYGGIIAGANALTKTGAGTLTLSGVNTYTGATNINAGVLSIAADSGLGTAPGSTTANDLNFGGGTLDVSSGFTLNSNRGIALNAGGGTIEVDAGTLAYGGIIAGANALTKTGAGTLTLSGVNTYTGATNINAGVLSIAADSGLGTAPGSTTANDLNFGGGTLDVTSGFTLNSNRGIALNAGGTIEVDAGTLAYGGIIAGANALTKTGAGTLTLSGINTYTGASTINAGILSIAADSGLGTAPGSTTANDLNFGGGTLDVTSGFTLNSNRGIALNAGGTIEVDAGILAYGGIIAGANALTKTGAGTLTLSGINTYTGASNINAGVFSIAADSGLGTAPGSATAGQITFGGGTLDATSGFTLNSNRGIALNAGGTIEVDAGTLAYGGIIAGAGNLTKSGAGTLSLGGTNTNTGILTVNNGTLTAASAGALGPASGLAISIMPLASDTALLDITALSSLTNTAGTITLDSSNAGSAAQLNTTAGITLSNPISLSGTSNTFDPSASTTILSGAITGTGALTLNGAGILQFNGTGNTYSGTTTINAGTLQANAANSLSGSSAVNLANVSGAILNLNNFSNSIASLAGGGGTGGNVSLGSGTLTIANSTASSSTSYAGVLSGTGGLTINLTGTGSPVQALTGSNTYSGVTTLSAGNLSIASDAGLGTDPLTATPGNIVLGGGTLEASTGFTLNSNRGIALNTGGGTIQVDSGTLIYGGIIAGANNLTKAGAGILQLSNPGNDYTGSTIVNGGILQAGASNVFGNGIITLANTAGATLDLNNFNYTITSLAGGGGTGGNITLGSGTLTIANAIASSSTSYAGVISGTGGLTLALTGTGSPALTLSGTNTYIGATTINSGTLIAASSGALGPSGGGNIALTPLASQTAILDLTQLTSLTNTNGAINFNSSASGSAAEINTLASISIGNAMGITGSHNQMNVIDNETTLNGVISGADTLNSIGSGTLILAGNSTFTGTTNVNAGVVSVQSSTGLGAAAATATVANGAVLAFTGSSLNVTNNLNFNNGSILVESAANNTTQLSGGIALNADNVSGGGVIINVANPFSDTLNISGAMTSGSNGAAINKMGLGTLELGGASTYTGSTTINLGRIQVDSSNALGSSALTLNAAGNAALILNGSGLSVGNNITLNNGSTIISNNGSSSNTLSGTVSVAAGSSTINVASADTLAFSNAISGSGTLNKTGTGTLSLSGNSSSYSGMTNVNAGTLSIASSANVLGTSTVNVNTNTTLNIAGSLGGNLTNNINLTNATLSESGTNTLGTGTIALSGINTFSPAGTLTVAGLLSGSGTLIMNGSGTLSMASGGANNTYSGSMTLASGTLQAGTASNPFGSGALNLNGGTLTAAQTTTLTNSLTVGGNATIGGSNNITLPALSLNSGSLTISDSGTTNFGGAVSGTGAINLSAGTTELSANNGSYNGAIAVNGGTLQVNNNNINPLGTGTLALNGGSFTSLVTLTNPVTNNFSVGGNASITGSNNINFSGTGTLASGDTLSITATGTTTLSGSLSGSGNMTVNGGTVILSGNNTGFSPASSYAGTTTVTGASSVFSLTNSAALGYSAVTATSGGTFNVNGVTVPDNGNVITLNGGSLTTNGTAGLSSAITLAASSTDTINVNNSSTFTLNNNINGGATLNISGLGSMVMNGEIGNVTPLNSTNVTIAHITYGGTATITLYDQFNNSPITLTNDADLISLLGNIYVNGTVDGNHPFTVQADNGTTYLYGVIGAGTPVSTLQAFGQLIFGNGSVNTSGTQIYNGNVTLGSNTSLTAGGNSAIQFNGNISGAGNNLTLNSGTGGITVTGSLNAGDLILNSLGTSAAFGSLTANNTDIVGGGVVTANNQTYNGLLTLSGNTTLQTTGSGATQIIVNDGLNSNGNNLNVNGSTASTSNTFTFNSSTPVNVSLSATHNGVATNGSNTINFANVDTIDANTASTNIITAPSLPAASNFVITGAKMGYVNDPLFFNGFNVFQSLSGTDVATVNVPGASINPATGIVTFGSTTLQFIHFASINGLTPASTTTGSSETASANTESVATTSFGPSVSPIIQQPQIVDDGVVSGSNWVMTGTVLENMDQLQQQVSIFDENSLKNKTINPYCYATNP